MKITWNYLFVVEAKKQKKTGKAKTWWSGTNSNSRLPLARKRDSEFLAGSVLSVAERESLVRWWVSGLTMSHWIIQPVHSRVFSIYRLVWSQWANYSSSFYLSVNYMYGPLSNNEKSIVPSKSTCWRGFTYMAGHTIGNLLITYRFPWSMPVGDWINMVFFAVTGCSRNYFWSAIVLVRCSYVSVFLQSSSLHHFVIAPLRNSVTVKFRK